MHTAGKHVESATRWAVKITKEDGTVHFAGHFNFDVTEKEAKDRAEGYRQCGLKAEAVRVNVRVVEL